jgi:hypothetical protein
MTRFIRPAQAVATFPFSFVFSPKNEVDDGSTRRHREGLYAALMNNLRRYRLKAIVFLLNNNAPIVFVLSESLFTSRRSLVD